MDADTVLKIRPALFPQEGNPDGVRPVAALRGHRQDRQLRRQRPPGLRDAGRRLPHAPGRRAVSASPDLAPGPGPVPRRRHPRRGGLSPEAPDRPRPGPTGPLGRGQVLPLECSSGPRRDAPGRGVQPVADRTDVRGHQKRTWDGPLRGPPVPHDPAAPRAQRRQPSVPGGVPAGGNGKKSGSDGRPGPRGHGSPRADLDPRRMLLEEMRRGHQPPPFSDPTTKRAPPAATDGESYADCTKKACS